MFGGWGSRLAVVVAGAGVVTVVGMSSAQADPPVVGSNGCAAVPGNVVTNCGFSNNVQGWMFNSGAALLLDGNNTAAVPATRFVSPGTGSLSQAFTVSPGSTYQVGFWTKDYDTSNTASLDVTVSNTTGQDGITSIYHTTSLPSSYTYITGRFTAGTSTTSVLTFAGSTSSGTEAVDEVSVATTQRSQSITFPAPSSPATYAPDKTVGLTGSASSGLPVSYSVTGPCTVSGSTLTVTGAGSCGITATQPGNATYGAATPVKQTLVIDKAGQTITFPQPGDITFGDPAPTLAATASSMLSVTYTSTTPSVCTISGTTITEVSKGLCTINADQAGNTNYNPASTIGTSFSIGGRNANLSTITSRNLLTVSTRVTDATTGNAVPAGDMVSFTTGGTAYCAAATDSNGVATCTVPKNQQATAIKALARARGSLTADFAGDPTHKPASTTNVIKG